MASAYNERPIYWLNPASAAQKQGAVPAASYYCTDFVGLRHLRNPNSSQVAVEGDAICGKATRNADSQAQVETQEEKKKKNNQEAKVLKPTPHDIPKEAYNISSRLEEKEVTSPSQATGGEILISED
ncbi:hypothetical protein E2320_017045 [Naja naja]|nr:hypothetical protein E2320_017045 [Naja naja]